ncbi:MAG: EAL domain-containing protein [Xylophilus ampelinus]
MQSRIHSLRARIALIVTVLLLAVQVLGATAVGTIIASDARRNVDDRLQVAQGVFRQVVQSHRDRLTQAATVVAADYGFREAVAVGNEATIVSALRNHGNRISADLVMLLGLDGELVADTRDPAEGGKSGQAFAYPDLVGEARRNGNAAAIGLLDGRLYELVVVPVRAPVTIAWIVMGFRIDAGFVETITSITGLDVSFLGRAEGAGQAWTLLAGSLPGPAAAALPAAFAALPRLAAPEPQQAPAVTLELAGAEHRARVVRLHGGAEPVVAVLQQSMDEALAPLRRLQSTLLLLTLAGVAVSVLVSLWTARNLARPIGMLTRFARGIGEGQYPEPIAVRRDDEIGALARTFNRMREALIERERRITDLAYRDALTGLPNRVLFSDRLQQAIAAAARAEDALAVMVMDLDRFKYVNDTLGHPIGDLLLREVGERLRRALMRATDTVARLGGDEFAVLLPGADLHAARHVARRMRAALEQPMVIDGQLVDVSASIGIVAYPQHGDGPHDLMRRADVAMYAAKRADGGVAVYDERHDNHTLERLSLMSELRQAVERDELTLHYQPKLDLASGAVRQVEALVRWDHATRGFVSPDRFVPFAEQTGYIKAITQWVAGRALAQCAEWRARGIALDVSINVSARDLPGGELPGVFAALLARHQLDPSCVWVEITESAVMEDAAQALQTLEQLHALGIRLSIDDFGTGYSSLAYLKRMPVDEIKIDRSFVLGMGRDPDDETIVRSTIDLGHNMGLVVVAEGVEDAAVMERLRALGCDRVQGYHLSKPLPPAQLEAWLRDRQARDAEAASAAAPARAAD